ncbi:MAG TPA: hypothetical protein VKY19_10940 [Ktedonosporobacter sp.]|nr:hypothetical protein [Ktedonosporobacter sp.]
MQSQHISLYEVRSARQISIPMTNGTILHADTYQPTIADRFLALMRPR